MRKILFVAWCTVAIASACFAQDVIVTKDAKRINAKVMEVNVDNIRYRDFDNMDGPVYTLLKSDIVTILYQNGKVETFDVKSPIPKTENPAVDAQRARDASIALRYKASTDEIVNLMRSDYPELYKKYESGSTQQGAGNVCIFLSIASAVGGIIMIVDGNKKWDGAQQVKTGTILAAGVAPVLMCIGAPLSLVGIGRKNEAINTCRRLNPYAATEPSLKLNLYGNGVGLALVF